MPRGRTTDRWIVALLVLGGLLLAAFGVRTWMLERDQAARRGVERAHAALNAAAKDALARVRISTVPPIASWQIDAPVTPQPAKHLMLIEAQHLLDERADTQGALHLLARLARSGEPERFVAALRAGQIAFSQDDRATAAAYWKQAARAPAALLDRGLPVRASALYGLCRLEFRADAGASTSLEAFLQACLNGQRLPRSGMGVVDLLIALASQVPEHPRSDLEGTHLPRAAAHARDGLALLERLPNVGEGVAGSSLVVRRDRVLLRLPYEAALPKGIPMSIANADARVPTGYASRLLPPPLNTLRLQIRPEPEGGPGALVLLGMALGFSIYVLGAVFAVATLRRSRATARMQRDFVAAVSHELKTPIASVRAMAELLGDGVADDPERTRRYADRIEHEMQRLGATVRNVLDVSRIEEGGSLPVSLQPGDPATVVERVAESFAPLLRRRGFAFTWRAEPAARALPIDRDALGGVLVNLLDNAAKYSTGERKAIDLVGEPTDDGYRIQVSDRGMGIAPQDAKVLFERFHRAANATEAALPGVGLGLHVVREVVRAHGGRVTAAPRDGGGSVFTVELGEGKVGA